MKLGICLKDLGEMNKDKIKLYFKLMGKHCVVKMFNYMLQSASTHKHGVLLFPFLLPKLI